MTSKVRAAITIANVSPGGMPLLARSRLSELSRLSNRDNMTWIESPLAEDSTLQRTQSRKSANLQIINGLDVDQLHTSSSRLP